MDTPLDSDAAGRVLRRAQEIESAHSVGADDDGVGVSSRALIEAAEEVGIDPNSVRDALALERFDADRPEGARLDRLVGASSIVVERIVHRAADDALSDVEDWLSTSHRMRIFRQGDGMSEAQPRPGLAASVSRRASKMSGDEKITGVDRLRIGAQSLVVGSTAERPRTLVRIVAERTSARRRRLTGTTLAGAAGAGVTALGVAEGLLLGPALAVPLIGGGYVIARSGRERESKLELELVRILTAVDRGERPVGLVGRATSRARRVVSDVRGRR